MAIRVPKISKIPWHGSSYPRAIRTVSQKRVGFYRKGTSEYSRYRIPRQPSSGISWRNRYKPNVTGMHPYGSDSIDRGQVKPPLMFRKKR